MAKPKLVSGDEITLKFRVIEERSGNLYLISSRDPGVRLHMFENEALSAMEKEADHAV